MLIIINVFLVSDGGFGGDDAVEGIADDEEGGGWDVDDDDLELPADLVRINTAVS